MTTDAGDVLYAVRDGHWVFRFEGAIRYTMIYPLDEFLEQTLSASEARGVIADLRDTASIDSTGVGLLAKLARIARAHGIARPLLYCASAEVREALESVCLDRVFAFVEGEPRSPALRPLPSAEASEAALGDTIEEAHRMLCELSEHNRTRFASVLESFERSRHAKLAATG